MIYRFLLKQGSMLMCPSIHIRLLFMHDLKIGYPVCATLSLSGLLLEYHTMLSPFLDAAACFRPPTQPLALARGPGCVHHNNTTLLKSWAGSQGAVRLRFLFGNNPLKNPAPLRGILYCATKWPKSRNRGCTFPLKKL